MIVHLKRYTCKQEFVNFCKLCLSNIKSFNNAYFGKLILSFVTNLIILGNNGLEYVRQFILENADVVAIIDCPVESFLPSTDTKTSLLVLKKKKQKGLPQTFDTFMAIAKTCGHDRRGKETRQGHYYQQVPRRR